MNTNQSNSRCLTAISASAALFMAALLAGCQATPRNDAVPARSASAQENASSAAARTSEEQARFERDRQAILAMAGSFEVEFNFRETVAVRPGYELTGPYHSGGVEWVTVLEDAGERIVLQHVLVACSDPDGEETADDEDDYNGGEDTEAAADTAIDIDEDCFPIKHWRQDWVYQDTTILDFRGKGLWEKVTLQPGQVRGTWSQAVYQVDDSPRYEGYGRWSHEANQSVWQSEITWRPLPRREHTVRDDYHVMVAVNRHVVTPNGWHHEQDNYKLDLDDDTGHPVIARETGLNHYLPIDAPELRLASEYMQDTDQFWAAVREYWEQQMQRNKALNIATKVDDTTMYERMFDLADEHKGADHADNAMQRDIRRALANYVEPKRTY